MVVRVEYDVDPENNFNFDPELIISCNSSLVIKFDTSGIISNMVPVLVPQYA